MASSGLPVATFAGLHHQHQRASASPNPRPPSRVLQAVWDTGVDAHSRAFYASEGFLDAVVDPEKVTFTGDKTRASVAVTVRGRHPVPLRKDQLLGDLVFYPNTETAQ